MFFYGVLLTRLLNRIEMLKDWRCFKTDDVFDFRTGVNLVVGEQGTGKSSLLKIINGNNGEGKNLVKFTTDGKIETRTFDFEKDSPRVNGKPIETMTQLVCLMSSHGQMVKKIVEELTRWENLTIIMDEPDMALSIRSCHYLVDCMKKSESNGCQIIAAVHNPIVIAGFDEVYSMEHRKWMASKEFIQCHTP